MVYTIIIYNSILSIYIYIYIGLCLVTLTVTTIHTTKKSTKKIRL